MWIHTYSKDIEVLKEKLTEKEFKGNLSSLVMMNNEFNGVAEDSSSGIAVLDFSRGVISSVLDLFHGGQVVYKE